MASRYSVFLNSKTNISVGNTFQVPSRPCFRNIENVFAKCKMETMNHVQEYSFRCLTEFEEIRMLWYEMKYEKDGGANALTDLVHGFAMTMKKVLDRHNFGLNIQYDIQMNAKNVKKGENLFKIQPTELTFLENNTFVEYDKNLDIRINVKHVSSLKVLFECLIHDITTALLDVKTKLNFENQVSIAKIHGKTDALHSPKWFNIAAFLLENFCVEEWPLLITRRTQRYPVDIREVLDVTMKVSLLTEKKDNIRCSSCMFN